MCLHSFISEGVADPSVGGRFSAGTCVSVHTNKARCVSGAEESGIAEAEVHPNLLCASKVHLAFLHSLLQRWPQNVLIAVALCRLRCLLSS